MTRRSALLLAFAAGTANGIALAAGIRRLRRRTEPQGAAVEPGVTAATLQGIEGRLAAIEATLAAREVARAEPQAWSEAEFPRTRPAASYLDEGNVYFEIGQLDRAVERFERAIALDPSLGPAYYNRANALRRLGDPAAAMNDYDRAAELLPDDAEVLNNRALALLDDGRFDEAIAAFQYVATLAPKDAAIVVNLAAARLAADDPAGALVDFERAQALQPSSEALYGAALALARLGRADEALDRLAAALARDSELRAAAAAEPGFVPLRSQPRFAALLRGDIA